MLKLNGNKVDVGYFPDRTQSLKISRLYKLKHDVENLIYWKYETDEELATLIFVTKHLHELKLPVSLSVPYVPNARMDRVKEEDEVFTLKYFCSFINDLNFKTVYIFDPHSNVSVALLDRVRVITAQPYINRAISTIEKDDLELVLYFPDEGAAKRYSDMFPGYKYVIGMKKRNWEDGKIIGLDVITNGIDLTGKTVLMIDDICSYGGTFKYSADELKRRNVDNVYAYATHTENSVLDKDKGTLLKSLEDGTVEILFTTASIYTGEHKNIQVLNYLGGKL